MGLSSPIILAVAAQAPRVDSKRSGFGLVAVGEQKPLTVPQQRRVDRKPVIVRDANVRTHFVCRRDPVD